MANLEIERRFKLKSLPDVGEQQYAINQYYGCDLKGNYRLRKRVSRDNSIQYFITRKKFLSYGTFEEDESEISDHDFNVKLRDCTKCVRKKRYHFKYGGLLFEIDKFIDINLIIMEVELERIDQPILIPYTIRPLIEKEITGDKTMSNSSLAKPYTHISQ